MGLTLYITVRGILTAEFTRNPWGIRLVDSGERQTVYHLGKLQDTGTDCNVYVVSIICSKIKCILNTLRFLYKIL